MPLQARAILRHTTQRRERRHEVEIRETGAVRCETWSGEQRKLREAVEGGQEKSEGGSPVWVPDWTDLGSFCPPHLSWV